jgi:hypothetical protein
MKMKELTKYQEEILRVAALSVSELPQNYSEMNAKIWEAYNIGKKHKATNANEQLEKQYLWLWKHCTIKHHSEDSVNPIEHTPGTNEYAKNEIEYEMIKAR